MAALPPSEDPIPPKPPKVPQDERYALWQQGFWVDQYNRSIHLQDMHELYIHKVLDMLWSWANQEAERENKKQRLCSIFYDVPNEMPQREQTDADLYYELDTDWIDAITVWEAHPFVKLALQALRIRDYNFELPWERKLPF